jgi:para-nitrobenzyl esterase
LTEIANTRSGRIKGKLVRGGGLSFRGIPFAEPPLGPLRFRAPQPVGAWTGVQRAEAFGPSAPQAGVENWLVKRFIGSATVGQSEDCLYLNVWTPAVDAGRRPVLVFIHGGAFLMGSGSTLLYNGSRLAARGDVVVVTLNYRLGALGALDLRGTLGADDAPANLGLRDQIAALAWVRANIDAFGGDPDAVTIFGESAGAMSIGTLLGTKAASGLFRRAILQSGAAHNVSTPEQAQRVAALYLKLLGPHGESLARLREAPLRELLRAQREAAFQLALPLGGLAFQPCVDGDLLPESPLVALERGSAKDVSVMAGTNRDEWKLFMIADARSRSMDEAALRRRFARVLPESEAERAYASYRSAPHAKRPDDTRERWSAFQGDRVFHWPAARLLELASRHSRETFAYSFTWSPPLLGRQIGACHGLELPFVFGTILEPWLRPWLGAMPGARKLSHRMQESWLAFAKTGHPGHAGVPFWPAYDTEKRQAMKFGRNCAAIPNYAESALRFFSDDR